MLYHGTDTKHLFYDHLFFTNGNGYEWLNGRLISKYESTDDEIFNNRKSSWLYNLDDYKKELKELEEELEECKPSDTYINYIERDVKRIKSKIKTFKPFYVNKDKDILITTLPYNIGSWNAITSIPINVKDDYLLGALESVDFYLDRFYMKYNQLDFQEMLKLQRYLINRFKVRLDGLGYKLFNYTINMTDDELSIHNKWDCESFLKENTTVYIAKKDTNLNDVTEKQVIIKKGEKIYVTKDSITTNNEYLDTLGFNQLKNMNFIKL